MIPGIVQGVTKLLNVIDRVWEILRVTGIWTVSPAVSRILNRFQCFWTHWKVHDL